MSRRIHGNCPYTYRPWSINPALNDNYALKVSCNNGFIDIVRLLLNCEVNVDAENYCSLIHAVARGHKEIVRLLLPHVGENAPTEKCCALARTYNHIEIAAILMVFAAKPLPQAIPSTSFRKIADTLLAYQESPILMQDLTSNSRANLRQAQLRTQSEIELVRIDGLIDASVKATNKKEMLDTLRVALADLEFMFSTSFEAADPLNLFKVACDAGFTESVRVLIDFYGNDVCLQEGLNHAMKRGRTDVVRLLLDAVPFDTRIGFRQACSYGYVDIVRLFLERGCTTDQMALALACDNNCIDVLRILVN